MTSVSTAKFNPEPAENLNQSNYISAQLANMAGDEALSMTSLVLIIATYIYIYIYIYIYTKENEVSCAEDRMRLMSLQMNCSGPVCGCKPFTGSARRRRETKRVLAEELKKLTRPEDQ